MSESVQLLRALVKRMAGFTNSELVDATGLAFPTIKNIRYMRHSPTFDTAAHLERGLNKLERERDKRIHQ